jgi:hypothetical protein
MSDHCADHDTHMKCVGDISKNMALLQKDIEYLRRDQEVILSRFGKHVDEADKDGGWHSRITTVETDLRNTKIMGRWFMIGSGFIGGMMGAGAPEAFIGIIRAFGLIK